MHATYITNIGKTTPAPTCPTATLGTEPHTYLCLHCILSNREVLLLLPLLQRFDGRLVLEKSKERVTDQLHIPTYERTTHF